MLVIQHTNDFRIEKPTIVTIGTFDGVHLGHQKILNRLRELKEKTGLMTVVLTFDPHPRKVLFPDQKDLKLITLIDEKLELLEKYGVDVTVVYPFNEAFSNSDAAYYVTHILLKQLHVNYLVIGHDHRFGKNRSGNIQTLKEFASQKKFKVEEISAQDIDHIAISSSKIRKALEDGNIELATEYSGHPFFLTGEVIKGKQLGRQLGYPTANLLPESADKILPKTGVYFVQVTYASKPYYGMLNVGFNPTTDTDRRVKIEVYIFDFNLSIYGQNLKVSFLKRLRDELKFESLEALKTQLQLDEKLCLNLMGHLQ